MPHGGGGHVFYSMSDWIAGKCAFPMVAKPCRSKKLVILQSASQPSSGTLQLSTKIVKRAPCLDFEQEG